MGRRLYALCIYDANVRRSHQRVEQRILVLDLDLLLWRELALAFGTTIGEQRLKDENYFYPINCS